MTLLVVRPCNWLWTWSIGVCQATRRRMQAQVSEGSRGRVTMAVGALEDANGNRVTVVATSEPRGYLRPGVTLNPGEIVIQGTGHAEAGIAKYASENGYRFVVGAGRPICPSCAAAIMEAGGIRGSPPERS